MTEKLKYERPVIVKHYAGFANKFGSRPVNTPITNIDNVNINSIVEKYGSPVFVVSESKMRQNQRNFNRVFKTRYPKVQFAWSYKTNYLNAVCSVFHQEGSWAEVVSEFEYDKARALGVKGNRIIFNGPGKTKQGLLKAIQEGARIHIDHFDELYDIIEITEEHSLKAKVAIRINMDVGIYPKWDRFGFNYENGEANQAIKRIMANKNLDLVGLHTHIGTYMMTADPYRIAATNLAGLVRYVIDEFSHQIEYIDLGGGFASNNTLIGQYLPAEQVIPTIEQYAESIVTGIFSVKLHNDELPTLFLESGRSLIDDAGFLITSVIANKRLSDGRRAIIVDAGVNLLFTKFWYKHRITPAQQGGLYTEDSSIFGPLCMNIDCLAESINLPPMSKGDKLVIEYVGAYDMTQWMQFIAMRPNVVMISKTGQIELIRKSESLEYLVDREVVPEYLTHFKI